MADNSPPTVIYKPSWVANTFLVRAKKDGVGDVDPLKIQKLVYCLHGWNLAVRGHPAVGERFEAWPHGPVLSSLYHQFKQYDFHRIFGFAKDVDPSSGEEASVYVNPTDAAFYDVFNKVWERYKGFSGPQLSDMTHQPNTPWSYARKNNMQYISDTMIKAHFVSIANGEQ
ncbi:Panacea domain-containing protein [Hoeflea sp.]|uniref:Panacea domain-containing protein n=1 Tax=Hoeflea sp. TaxID=1940281 RepID=UPI00374A0ED1